MSSPIGRQKVLGQASSNDIVRAENGFMLDNITLRQVVFLGAELDEFPTRQKWTKYKLCIPHGDKACTEVRRS